MQGHFPLLPDVIFYGLPKERPELLGFPQLRPADQNHSFSAYQFWGVVYAFPVLFKSCIVGIVLEERETIVGEFEGLFSEVLIGFVELF
jgi:hypothetical protein